MTNTLAPHTFIGSAQINEVRTALATHDWQTSVQVSHVERAAVIQMVIDWAQGRVEAPKKVAEAMSDLHIGSGRSGFSAAQRVNLIIGALADIDRDSDQTVHGTKFSGLYAPVTAEGLSKLLEWLAAQPVRETPAEVGEADETLEMHPNIRKALIHAGVTSREDVSAVMAHCHFRRNVSGGRTSDWIHTAAATLKRLGSAEALRADDQAANEALMARDRANGRV